MGLRIALACENPSDLRLLQRIIDGKQGNEIIWQTDNGLDVLQMARLDPPELLIMDLTLPLLDSVQTTRRVMTEFPCAILIVSPSLGHQTQALAFDVLDAGALDVLRHPLKGPDCDRILLEKIASLDSFIHRTQKRQAGNTEHQHHASTVTHNHGNQESRGLLAIAASTGGPAALVQVLKGLGRNIPWPVVVVQHVDRRFSQGLAQWLGQQIPQPVQVAMERSVLQSGNVYLAPSQTHLVVTDRQTLGYLPHNEQQHNVCPSADIFFHSLVDHWRGRAIGVLLTGMGRDGAEGLKAMRDHGWHTIAQDEKTSRVYGMPKAAVQLNAAVDVLALPQIPLNLRRHLGIRL